MLVLTRAVGETVVITHGDAVAVITVLERKTGEVRLGFDAPADVKIQRGEHLERAKG